MRIIAKSTLVEYYTKNPQAKSALEEWYEKTKKSEWTCFADIKNYNPFDLKRSAGVGVRVFLPMFGLLGVDWGWGFDQINGSSQYGGSQFHFVLGQEL